MSRWLVTDVVLAAVTTVALPRLAYSTGIALTLLIIPSCLAAVTASSLQQSAVALSPLPAGLQLGQLMQGLLAEMGSKPEVLEEQLVELLAFTKGLHNTPLLQRCELSIGGAVAILNLAALGPQLGKECEWIRALESSLDGLLQLQHMQRHTHSGLQDSCPVAELAFPALRRMVIAAIAKQWLMYASSSTHAWGSPELAQSVGLLLWKLYRLHVTGLANSGLLEFTHVSKAGGTSMCYTAAANGCHTNKARHYNCLMQELDDHPRWVSTTHHQHMWGIYKHTNITQHPEAADKRLWGFMSHGTRRTDSKATPRTCASRLSKVRRAGWNFYANEFTAFLEEMQQQQQQQPGTGEAASQGGGEDISGGVSGSSSGSGAVGEGEGEGGSSDAAGAGNEAGHQDTQANAGDDNSSDTSVPQHRQQRRRWQRRLLAQAAAAAADGGAGDGADDDVGTRAVSDAAPGSLLTTCEVISRAIILREPLSRIKSHIQYVLGAFGKSGDRGDFTFKVLAGRPAAFWRKYMPAAMDNYLIRSLGGESVFYLPSGGVSEEHLQTAKEMLLYHHDVIHVLESNTEATTYTFHYGLGWAHTILEEHARSDQHLPVKVERALPKWMPKDLDTLRITNTLDEQLYSYGVLLSQLDQVLWRAMHMMNIPPYEGFTPAAADPPKADEAEAQDSNSVKGGKAPAGKEGKKKKQGAMSDNQRWAVLLANARAETVPASTEALHQQQAVTSTVARSGAGSSAGGQLVGALRPSCGFVGLHAFLAHRHTRHIRAHPQRQRQ